MKLITNPFEKKEPSPEELIKQQQKNQEDSVVLESATHPSNNDEAVIMQRQELFAELRRWQQDRDPAMLKLFEKLCARRISGNNITPIPNMTPMTSVNGAYQLINFIEALDVNLIMSNYSETRINLALRYGIGYPLIQFIRGNYKELGIEKDRGKLGYVINLMMNTIEPTFYRALNAGERNLDGKIYKINRIEDERKQEKKKGIFN